MVAHHEIAVRRAPPSPPWSGCRGTPPEHRAPRSGLPLSHTWPVIDADAVAGQRDHALDVALLRVARIVEDHDIAALDGLDVVDKFVDEEPVAVFQPRQHAGAFHAHRLVKKGDDQHRGGCGNEQIAKPEADGIAVARGRRALRGCLCRLCCNRRSRMFVEIGWHVSS